MKKKMKKKMKRLLCIVLSVILALSMIVFGSAKKDEIYAENAYATILTGSDFQGNGAEAYNRFDKILHLAMDDGMPNPCSILVGGDYTLVLGDNAVPGISRIRHIYTTAFPENDPASVVCIQGNHDNSKKEFAETGFYDMGAYCLYVINENDFPWNQRLRSSKGVQKVAADLDESLNNMLENGDRRPVIVMTHVPLHHTDRGGYGDNMYASYIFNVLNKKAQRLDIIFIYGHNHSGDYDDYIGGSVNFMKSGDTIRVPLSDKRGEDCYTEETLNFTYTNCGYIGYSNNHQSETSTDVLTMGIIQLTGGFFRFIKYTEDGVYSVNDVAKINRCNVVNTPVFPALDDSCLCHSSIPALQNLWKFLLFFMKPFGLNPFCVCGGLHY